MRTQLNASIPNQNLLNTSVINQSYMNDKPPPPPQQQLTATLPSHSTASASSVNRDEVLYQMVETLRESSHLGLREMAVREREKALNEKENLFVSHHVKHSYQETFRDAEKEMGERNLKDKENYWIAKELKLQNEIESLKSTIFKLQVKIFLSNL